MLSRTNRFFSAATYKFSIDVLTSFQGKRNYFPMQTAGFDTSFVSSYPPKTIEACERLFTHKSGVDAYTKLASDKNWLKGTPEDIKQRVASALAQFPKDIYEGTDSYAEALNSACLLYTSPSPRDS